MDSSASVCTALFVDEIDSSMEFVLWIRFNREETSHATISLSHGSKRDKIS